MNPGELLPAQWIGVLTFVGYIVQMLVNVVRSADEQHKLTTAGIYAIVFALAEALTLLLGFAMQLLVDGPAIAWALIVGMLAAGAAILSAKLQTRGDDVRERGEP